MVEVSTPLLYREGSGVSLMKETTKRTLKRIFDIVVTVLTALITSVTASSCGLRF